MAPTPSWRCSLLFSYLMVPHRSSHILEAVIGSPNDLSIFGQKIALYLNAVPVFRNLFGSALVPDL